MDLAQRAVGTCKLHFRETGKNAMLPRLSYPHNVLRCICGFCKRLFECFL